MAKILSIIIIIIIFAGGGWYYKNNMKAPAEGSPVGYESGKSTNLNKNSPIIIFPNASSILVPGQKIKTAWKSPTSFNLSTYPVILVDVNNRDKKPVVLGTAKNSLFSKVFSWTVPLDTAPGSYKIVFVAGKQSGESEVFKVSPSDKEGYKLTTTALRATSTIIFVEYNVVVDTTKVDPANVNIRITCPIKNVSVRTPGDSVDKCQKIVPNLGVVENLSGPNTKTYIFQFAFTNSNNVAEMITAEAIVNNNLFDSGKVGAVVASVVSMIDPTPTTPVNNPGPAIFSKISSDISVIKNNNIDTGVSVNFRLNIQANKSDIYASGTTAVVVVKDVTSGKVVTEKVVPVIPMESGMMYFADGATKPISIQAVFPASIFPAGMNNVKASIYSINYRTVGSIVASSTIYTALDFGLYDTAVTIISK